MKTSKSLTLSAALVLACTLTESVRAQVFVAETGGSVGTGFISEYAFDGSPINPSLISGFGDPAGLAISGGDLFVTDLSSGTIGEYATDGSPINPSLISGLSSPGSIAISGGDIFVDNTGSGTVGEYTLSGAPVNTSLISGLSGPALAVIPDLVNSGDSDLFLVNSSNASVDKYTISGGLVTAVHPDLILGLTGIPLGLAISGGDIFVANNGYGNIGEYTISGGTVNASLINYGHPNDLAILDGNIFVTSGNGTVGEFTTAGGTVDASLISGLSNPGSIAVMPMPAPEPSTCALMAFGLAALLGLRRRK